jgi:hypothetical protein
LFIIENASDLTDDVIISAITALQAKRDGDEIMSWVIPSLALAVKFLLQKFVTAPISSALTGDADIKLRVAASFELTPTTCRERVAHNMML